MLKTFLNTFNAFGIIFIIKNISENRTILNMCLQFGTIFVTNWQFAPWTFEISPTKFKTLDAKKTNFEVDLSTI